MGNIVVRQIGNGGAFNYDMTNTAFTLLNDQVLVDCGYNVFPALMERKLIDNIKVIFITHEHDDHIGSLMTLIYYNEFIRKKKLTVFLPPVAYNYIGYFVNEKGLFKYPNDSKKLKYVDIVQLDESEMVIDSDDDSMRFRVFTQRLKTHGVFENTVYHFLLHDYRALITITGDTKACIDIEDKVREIAYKYHNKVSRLIVFHDYSTFNHPDNMHATEFDFETIYSDDFKQFVVKVHDGNKEFKEVYTPSDIPQLHINLDEGLDKLGEMS